MEAKHYWRHDSSSRFQSHLSNRTSKINKTDSNQLQSSNLMNTARALLMFLLKRKWKRSIKTDSINRMHQSKSKKEAQNKMLNIRWRNRRLNWTETVSNHSDWKKTKRHTWCKSDMTSISSNEHGIHYRDGFLLWKGESKWWRFGALKNAEANFAQSLVFFAQALNSRIFQSELWSTLRPWKAFVNYWFYFSFPFGSFVYFVYFWLNYKGFYF